MAQKKEKRLTPRLQRKLRLEKYYRENLENRIISEEIADMLKSPPCELPESYEDNEDGMIDPDEILEDY